MSLLPILVVNFIGMLSRVAGETYQGAVQGLAGSLGAVASVAGLVLGGLLYATLGPRVFLVSAAVILVVSLVGVTTTRLAANT